MGKTQLMESKRQVVGELQASCIAHRVQAVPQMTARPGDQATRQPGSQAAKQYLATLTVSSQWFHSKWIRSHPGIEAGYKNPWTSKLTLERRGLTTWKHVNECCVQEAYTRLMVDLTGVKYLVQNKSCVTNQMTNKIGHHLKLHAPRPLTQPNWTCSGESAVRGGKLPWTVAAEGFQLLFFGEECANNLYMGKAWNSG